MINPDLDQETFKANIFAKYLQCTDKERHQLTILRPQLSHVQKYDLFDVKVKEDDYFDFYKFTT